MTLTITIENSPLHILGMFQL